MSNDMSPEQARLVQDITRRNIRDLDIGTDPSGGSALLDALLGALEQATAGTRTLITRDGRPVAMIVPATRDSGPDVFKTTVYGSSYPALIETAEAEARGFYGPDSPLVVEHVGSIWRTIGGQAAVNRGAYNTQVTIRCTQLPEGWNVP